MMKYLKSISIALIACVTIASCNNANRDNTGNGNDKAGTEINTPSNNDRELNNDVATDGSSSIMSDTTASSVNNADSNNGSSNNTRTTGSGTADSLR